MNKVLKGIRTIELIITGVVFLSALIVLSINILLRQVFNNALSYAEEYMRYAIIWVTFVGCSICAEEDAHVGIDIVYQLSTPPTKKFLRVFCMFFATLFCALFIWFSIRNTALLYKTMQRSAVMLMPMWIVYLSMPLGAVLSTIHYGLKLVSSIRKPVDDYGVKKDDDINILDLN